VNKNRVIAVIVRLYFAAAIIASFSHVITTSEKLGLTGWELWSTPFMVDGIAIIGLVMRSASFSSDTQRIGFRTQMVAGGMSLVANVAAAHTFGGYLYGVGVVALFVYAEWLSGKIESAESEQARIFAEEAAAKRASAVAKAAATRKRNARRRKTEARVLEEMLAG
jgi:hypothetical protein